LSEIVLGEKARLWPTFIRQLEGEGMPHARQLFGSMRYLPSVLDFFDRLEGRRLSKNPPRSVTMSYEQAGAFIALALERGDKSIALVQALQFDCYLRQNDVRGEWARVPADYVGKPGEVVRRGKVWRGMTMDMIDVSKDLMVRTSKTGQPVVHAPDACPLVMTELKHFSDGERTGPVARQRDGSPGPDRQSFSKAWREIATAVGIPKDVWNMDSRALAISEAAEAGVPDDDIINQSGHADKAIERAVYKRRGREISRRSQEKRRELRESAAAQAKHEGTT